MFPLTFKNFYLSLLRVHKSGVWRQKWRRKQSNKTLLAGIHPYRSIQGSLTEGEAFVQFTSSLP